jgi:hypothetical protein
MTQATGIRFSLVRSFLSSALTSRSSSLSLLDPAVPVKWNQKVDNGEGLSRIGERGARLSAETPPRLAADPSK